MEPRASQKMAERGGEPRESKEGGDFKNVGLSYYV